MAHIKRIDLTRDVEAHAEAYRKAIENVCKETAFSGGKYADAFDKEFAAYVGSKFASGVNNGTSALHLAMLALGVGPGDEVIVPANTYIATAWGVSYTGATPVFADCTPDTWEIDPSVLEAKITEKTKGIIGVHLYGQPFDYEGVRKIADRHGLFVVEDCAQAHGAKFEDRNVGTLGDLACFSFYPGKNLYAFGEGGSVTCQEEKYYKHIDRLKNQGCDVRLQLPAGRSAGGSVECQPEISAGVDEETAGDRTSLSEGDYKSVDHHAETSGEHHSGFPSVCHHAAGS